MYHIRKNIYLFFYINFERDLVHLCPSNYVYDRFVISIIYTHIILQFILTYTTVRITRQSRFFHIEDDTDSLVRDITCLTCTDIRLPVDTYIIPVARAYSTRVDSLRALNNIATSGRNVCEMAAGYRFLSSPK